MRIDLHTHTQKLKKGDGNTRRISPADFVKKMSEEDVGICAITNHNKFDKAEYDQVIALDPNLTIFPGIELDVDFNSENRHIVVVGNPGIAKTFYETFDADPSRHYDSYTITFNDFVAKVRTINATNIIIIPHFLDKDKGLQIDERDWLLNKLQEYTIILETAKLRSMGVVNDHEEHLCLIGSDVKDWSEYSGEILPELKFDIDSFEKFYELASDAKKFVKNFLNGAPQCSIPVDDRGGKVTIFEDVNVIFGEKGSGKTILLKDYIYPYFGNAGKSVFLHEGKDYTKIYKKMLNEHEDSVVINQDLYSTVINEFNAITEYNEPNNQNFIQGYIDYRQDNSKNKKSKRILKALSTFSNKNTETVEKIIQTAESRMHKIDEVSKINSDIRGSSGTQSREALENELNKLKVEIQQLVTEKHKDIFIAQNTEAFLSTLRQSLQKKTRQISKPINIGFSKLVANRLARYESNNELVRALRDIQTTQSKNIGTLPGKGLVTYETSVVTLSEEDRHGKESAFVKSRIVQNRELVKKIQNFSVEDFARINEYFDSLEKDIEGEVFAEDVIKKNNIIKVAGNDHYSPSEGEKAILSISGVLESYNYNCYLFDEIERGLGHKYMIDYLVPRLKKLRDAGKTVILSTHNANIAVNTLPGQVVYCNYPDNNNYYAGNMYSNELVGVVDNAVLNWEENAIIHLEGSEEMFNRRRNIYGV